MPNYCTNFLSVRGSDEDIDIFLNSVKGDCVVPSSMDDIREIFNDYSGHDLLDLHMEGQALIAKGEYDFSGLTEEEKNLWASAFVDFQRPKGNPEKAKDAFSLGTVAYPPPKVVAKGWRDESGGTYEWITREWGDRYCMALDICRYKADSYRKNLARLDIRFETPWCSVAPGIQKLMIKFPNLDMTYTWCEQGNRIAGVLHRRSDGKIVFYDERDDMDDAIDFIRKLVTKVPEDDQDEEYDSFPDYSIMQIVCDKYLGEEHLEIDIYTEDENFYLMD